MLYQTKLFFLCIQTAYVALLRVPLGSPPYPTYTKPRQISKAAVGHSPDWLQCLISGFGTRWEGGREICALGSAGEVCAIFFSCIVTSQEGSAGLIMPLVTPNQPLGKQRHRGWYAMRRSDAVAKHTMQWVDNQVYNVHTILVSGNKSQVQADFCQKVEKLQTPSNITQTSQKGASSVWAIMVIAQLLAGIGTVPIQPFGISYVDDFAEANNSPLYVGKYFS